MDDVLLRHLPPSLTTARLTGALRLAVLGDTGPGQSLPLESSQSGSVFADRFDTAVGWYLPVLGPSPEPDDAFGFEATVAGVDAQSGDPFDTALLSLSLGVSEPPDLAAARAAAPEVAYRPVPMDGLGITLTLTAKGPTGADAPLQVAASVTATTATSVTVQAQLVGALVVVAFDNLRRSSDLTVTVQSSYTVWRQWRPPVRRGPGWWPPREVPFNPDDRLERFPRFQHAVPTVAHQTLVPQALLGTPAGLGTVGKGADLVAHLPTVDLVDQAPEVSTTPVWTTPVHARTDTVSVGSQYAHDVYRPRYTITSGGTTRAIIDITDLKSFTATRSEFRELTSLGDVPTRYPSLRRLYLGEVTGLVVVVPQSYGVLRGSSGTALACQAVVDDSATGSSGCRFDVTAVLAPVVDPVDLAQLADDLLTVPEAEGRSLLLSLPGGLDPHTPSTFPAVAGTTATVADGPLPHSVVLSMSIGDTDAIPAVCNVNTLFGQLASGAPPTGEVMVRLDDAYPTPVGTSLVLSLSDTADGDDVSVVSAADGASAVVVTNAGPVPLAVSALAELAPAGPVVTALDTVLAAGASCLVPVADAAVPTVVRRRLAVPDPLVKPGIFDYVALDVTTVTQEQHPLSVDAAFDFAAAGVRQLDLATSLPDYPGVVVAGLTLTPTHRIDSVHALVPIDVVVAGLRATVQVTVTATDGTQRSVVLEQDFIDHPILTLTSASIGR